MGEKVEKEILWSNTPNNILRDKYLRKMSLPTIFCPGCGLGQIIQMLTRSFDVVNINKDNTVIVSGIGCTARIPGYFDMYSLNTTHGRAIPVATAIKLAKPELTVIVISGDGDLGAIGGNHFLHALRRNVGIKVICANNLTYGMTGGQVSPTSPHGAVSTSYPWLGNPETELDMAKLASVGGAPYVVRWTTFQMREGVKSIVKALKKPGFAYIEFISPCPTQFGRRNNAQDISALKQWFDENTKMMPSNPTASPQNNYFVDIQTEKILLGKFHELDRPTFEEKWQEICNTAKEEYRKRKSQENLE